MDVAPNGIIRRMSKNVSPSVLSALPAVAVVAWLAVIWLWSAGPFFLTFDDAFYYFEIARNIGEGHGSTFDRINPTNGYHPLWMVLCVPLFATGAEGLMPVRVVLSLQAIAWAAVLYALGRAVVGAVGDRPVPRGAWLVAFGALAALTSGAMAMKCIVNGLETTLLVSALAGLLIVGLRTEGDLLARPLVAASLLSVGVLARTDVVFLVAVVAVQSLLSLRGRWPELLKLLVPPAVTTAVYMGVNLQLFGHLTQVSGDLKRVGPSWGGMATVFGIGLIVFLGARATRNATGDSFPRLVRVVRSTGFMGLHVGVLLAYYLGFQSFPRLWYFGPVLLWTAVLIVPLALDLAEKAVEESEHGEGRALATIGGILLIPLVAGFGVQAKGVVEDTLTPVRLASRSAATWINDNLPADAVLGSWDAGVVGYFTHARIINLDGVVNSHDYLAAMRDHTAGPFLAERGLSYLVNHSDVEEGLHETAELFLGLEMMQDMEELQRWEFTFTGSTNKAEHGEHQMAVFLYEL